MATKNPINKLLDSQGKLQAACVVKYPWGEQWGIAIMNTHNIGEWKAMGVMIFWEDGDVTVDDGLTKKDIVIPDLWEYLRQMAQKKAG